MPAANYTVSATFLAIDKFSSKLISMGKKATAFATKTQAVFAKAEMATRRLTRGVGRLTKKFGALGVVMGGALIIGGVSNMINKFADFEQANANLASVMASATGPELQAMQKNAKFLGATTAKSATQVVGLQEAFARLGFKTPQIIDMTEATIAGSVAMQGELAATAELVGAMVRSFDNLESKNAPSIIDQMTRATQKSALNFEKLQTALPIVSGAANAAGIRFNKLLALLGKLSDSGIDASSSATALRNIFLESAKQGLNYEQILEKIANNQDKLTAANDQFGKRAAVSSLVLAKNLQQTKELSESLLKGSGAQEAAAKQLDTLRGRLTILGSAWEGFILSVESGNGKIGQFLKTVIEVATEILSLASGSAKAKDELNEKEIVIRKIASKVIGFAKVLGVLTAAFVALKVAIIANKAVMIGANFLRFVGIFMKIARAKGIWTAAQWALNVALNANPIGIIIMAIAALTGAVIWLVKNWKRIVDWVKNSDNWFAKLIRGSLKPIIWLFKQIGKAWQWVKSVFKSGKIGGFFKRIGRSILDFVLAPLEGILRLVNKISGGKIGGKLLARIETTREGLKDEGTDEGKQIESTKTAANRESLAREERIEKSQAEILIKKDRDIDIETEIPEGFPVTVTDTF
jgi:hypothetical protein